MKTTVWWGMVLLAVGCGGDEVAPDGTYIDRTTESDAWLAVAVDGDAAVAYVCGGADTLTTHTRWMTATVEGSALRFEEDGWRLEVELADDSLGGRLVAPDGEVVLVNANRPVDPLAGLYTAIDSGCRAGVIIATTGEAQGAWCDSFDNFSQVTPLAPIERGPEGIAVTATATPDGPHAFFVDLAVVDQIVASP